MIGIVIASLLQLNSLIAPAGTGTPYPPEPPAIHQIAPTSVVTSPLQDVPKFLTLPFPPDPHMALLQGWYYDSGGLQQGIDYYRHHSAETALESTNAFRGFPVVASADGYACGEYDDDEARSLLSSGVNTHCVSGYGNRVFIRHQVGGRTYYTYYGHLESIAADIPIGDRTDTAFVRRGQIIGYAGNTGTGGGNIHLHFGILNAAGTWFDPYDIRSTHEIYPDPNNRNNLLSGINDFWTTNPPSYASGAFFIPEGYVRSPVQESVVAGTVAVQGWAAIPRGRMNKIEIWKDGTLYRTAAYGLYDEEAGGDYGFQWEWDTTAEENGYHTIQVRAVGIDGSRGLLPASHGDQVSTIVVNVQNPHGFLDTPTVTTTLRGKVPLSGWAQVEGSQIEAVEVWIDGTLRGYANYGLPRDDLGGNVGYHWEWDTTSDPNGQHTIVVRAVAANGGIGTMVYGADTPLKTLTVTVDNIRTLPVGKWVVR